MGASTRGPSSLRVPRTLSPCVRIVVAGGSSAQSEPRVPCPVECLSAESRSECSRGAPGGRLAGPGDGERGAALPESDAGQEDSTEGEGVKSVWGFQFPRLNVEWRGKGKKRPLSRLGITEVVK